MIDIDKKLKEIFQNDSLRILDVKPKQSSVMSQDERLEESFSQINKFYKKNGREPTHKNGDVIEHQLYTRLQSIRESKEKIGYLAHLDKYNLLAQQLEGIKSIEDILENDTLGILNNDAEDIFTIKHIPKKADPEYVSSRKKCKNFEKYEPMFIKMQEQLKKGEMALRHFSDTDKSLEEQRFYVLGGVLLYLEMFHKDSGRTRKDGKTRCVFENGTESDMLYRSLSKQLYKDGRIVEEANQHTLVAIAEEDKETGAIYVLKSLSDKLEIRSQENLYKIGFSRSSIEERIKNAENEPTYLMAPVKIEGEWKCFNMNPQKLEKFLHHFFGDVRLELDIFDGKGRRHSPREWIIAPYETIERAIDLIVSDKALNYKYDHKTETIVECKNFSNQNHSQS